MESVTLHILSADGRMAKLEPRIRETVTAVIPPIVSAIGVNAVDLIVGVSPEETIPETGNGGQTQTPYIVFVWVDPEHPNVAGSFERELRSTITHEMYHAVRNRVYPWPGTLLEDVVGEGLADHFDLEINGGEAKPWARALSDNQLREMYHRAEPLFHTKGDGHGNWLFGSEEEQIPKWTGYALGFHLVGKYLQFHGAKPSALVSLEVAAFLETY